VAPAGMMSEHGVAELGGKKLDLSYLMMQTLYHTRDAH